MKPNNTRNGLPSVDMEKLLTPAASVSRAGKMAQSSMHVSALVRSGVAAFQKRTIARRPVEITVAEVVDPGALETFGSVTSTLDLGRNTEMCSSPRGHPELEHRLLRLMEGDKAEKFHASVADAVPNVRDLIVIPEVLPNVPPLALPAPPGKGSNTVTPRPPVAEPPTTSPTHKAPRVVHSSGTSSFKTTARFKDIECNNPPVGHYRPKYGVVDSVPRVAPLRGRLTTREGERSPRGELVECSLPATSSMASKAPSTHPNTADGKASPPKHASNNAQAPNTAPQRAVGTAPVNDWRNQNAVFKSGVKNCKDRPTKVTPATHLDYYPQDKITRANKSGTFVDLGTMTGRKAVLITKTSAPDVMYDAHKPSTRLPQYKFDRQVDRDKVMDPVRSGGGAQPSPPRNILGAPSPNGREHYDTHICDSLKFKRTGASVEFSKQTPRRSLSAGNNLVSDAFLETDGGRQATYAAARNVAAVRFEKYSPRPVSKPTATGLQYDFTTDMMSPRPQIATIRTSTKGHEELFNPNENDVTYKPNLSSVRPRQQSPPKFEALPGREAQVISREQPPKMLDVQYDRKETALTLSRVQGDPHMSTHMSRDRRTQLLALKTTNTDLIYNAKLDATHERTARGNIQFSKLINREEHQVGRGLNVATHVGRKKIAELPGPGNYHAKDTITSPRAPEPKFSTAKRVT
eukprot:PhM_4_TR5958/c0_g1_i1/m.55115